MLRRKVNILAISYLVIFLLAITSLVLIDIRIKDGILALAQSKVQLETVELINNVVNDKIVAQIEYEDIFTVHKDTEGAIVLLQANTIKLNQIMAKTAAELAKAINNLQETSVSIPLGQITGSSILSGWGPRVNVNIIPAGQINVDILNTFTETGINQSRHLIYFEIKSKLRIAVPFMEQEISIVSNIPLAETIIIGKVPETYVNMDDGSNGKIMVPIK
jgi:sporulation protein YunB